MILQTIETKTITQKKITYQPLQNYNIRYNQIESQKIQPTGKPLMLQNEKRLLNYNDDINKQNIQQTRSEMSRSTLARMNQDLQEKTNLFTNYGKYGSKWSQQSMNNFPTHSKLNVAGHSSRISVRSTGYGQKKYVNNQDYSRKKPQIQDGNIYIPPPNFAYSTRANSPIPQTYNFHTINVQPYPQQHHTAHSNVNTGKNVYGYQPQLRTEHSQNSSNKNWQNRQTYPNKYQSSNKFIQQPHFNHYENRNSHNNYDYNYKYYSDQQQRHILPDQLHQAKQVAKEQGREVKNQIKQNVRQAVGHQNYQLMSQAKNALGQVKENVKENVKQTVKDTFGQVYYTAKQAKDQVVQTAAVAKQAVKDGAKQTAKAVIGKQNFNLLAYMTKLMGQLTSNLLGTSNKDKTKQKQLQIARAKVIDQNTNAQGYMTKNESINYVSPIEYSQRTFRPPASAPIGELVSVWIYALVIIGIFLVIFQLVK